MSLREYQRKRDFRATSEPQGRARGGEGRKFVIERHDASSLHYDLRLEAGGVLKSWALPKGPSTDPKEKRLAQITEDHPIEYADFEGVIPEGEYGSGTVIVWDRGTYRSLPTQDDEELPVGQQVEQGHVKVWLEGEKLRGGFVLQRTGDERWLLIKLKDEGADARRNPVRTQPESVLSGKTNEELEDQGS